MPVVVPRTLLWKLNIASSTILSNSFSYNFLGFCTSSALVRTLATELCMCYQLRKALCLLCTSFESVVSVLVEGGRTLKLLWLAV